MDVSLAHVGVSIVSDIINLVYNSFQTGSRLFLSGKITKNDGFGGIWVYDDTSTATHDGYNVIRQNVVAVGSPGRWFKDQLYNGTGSKAVQNVSRSIAGVAFQPSLNKWTQGRYSIQIDVASPLLAGQNRIITMSTSPDNIVSYTNVGQIGNGISGVLNLSNTQITQLIGDVPPGYWVKLTASGTGSSTYILGQETYD